MRSRPREELERKGEDIRKLKQKVGELVMDIGVLQELKRQVNLDPLRFGGRWED